jgi:hypothetical protein
MAVVAGGGAIGRRSHDNTKGMGFPIGTLSHQPDRATMVPLTEPITTSNVTMMRRIKFSATRLAQRGQGNL